MPLAPEEIAPGAVAYFRVTVLNADEQLVRPEHRTPRDGPFLCFQSDGEWSAWTPLTTQGPPERPERLKIRDEWKLHGSSEWQKTAQYLTDGRNSYVGPDASFVAAAAHELTFTAPVRRPCVTADGVDAVVQEVRARGGATLS
jgi:hypothetical protein